MPQNQTKHTVKDLQSPRNNIIQTDHLNSVKRLILLVSGPQTTPVRMKLGSQLKQGITSPWVNNCTKFALKNHTRNEDSQIKTGFKKELSHKDWETSIPLILFRIERIKPILAFVNQYYWVEYALGKERVGKEKKDKMYVRSGVTMKG